MQNVYLNPNRWHWRSSDNKSDYIDPTLFMGIDNVEGTQWLYTGTPIIGGKKSKFKWVLYANKLRKR